MQDSIIEKELLHNYRDHLLSIKAESQDMSRVLALRPSGLPVCPVDFFIRHANYGASRVLDMRGAFFVTIGSAVHEVVQTYLAPSGKFLARWECLICGKLRECSMKHECCDFQMKYHEIIIDIPFKGGRIVGHIDAVFRDSKGRYWIVDYKTCSVLGYPLKKKDPSRAYLEQIEAYAYTLYVQYGILVHGVALMFIRRDNPNEPMIYHHVVPKERHSKIERRLSKYMAMHQEVLKVKTKEEALDLLRYGKCKNKYCKTCKTTVERSLLLRAYERGLKLGHLPIGGSGETKKRSSNS